MTDEIPLETIRRMWSGDPPPAFAHLGGEVVAVDPEAGTSEVHFFARPEFCNRWGQVQGGFVTAMLDSTSAVAGIAKSGFTLVMPTIELKTSFIAPAPQGRLIGRGLALRIGRSVAFLEGELYDPDGTLLARGSFTARPRPLDPADWSGG